VEKVASQCPAQATPFEAILRIEVLLDEKVTGVFKLVPDTVWTLEVKIMVPPRTIEVLMEGLREIFPANRGGPALLLPPQAEKFQQVRIATAKNRPERNLPMHPSSNLAVILREASRTKYGMNWKTCSLEVGAGI
jgi:hypothetical protein